MLLCVGEEVVAGAARLAWKKYENKINVKYGALNRQSKTGWKSLYNNRFVCSSMWNMLRTVYAFLFSALCSLRKSHARRRRRGEGAIEMEMHPMPPPPPEKKV